ncbi:MAG: beta-lactamase family protein [Parvibaculaceae bacterium]|nr:beta-lactamase family protein [Parvibaculaceae bacterium]
MKNKVLIVLASLVVLVGGVVVYNWQKVERLNFAMNLFTGAEQYENFNRMPELFPSDTMKAAQAPFQFEDGEAIALPATFEMNGTRVDTEKFLTDTDTAALLVIQDGKVRLEDYRLTGGRDVQWLSMSVAKSFTSTLVGMAVEDGAIDSIQDPVTKYVPALAGSAYDGVRIKDILQMSSGAAWDENYGDPESDINRFGRILGAGGSFSEFLTTMKRENEPGTYNRYNSASTQVLGSLLLAATGQPIQEYMAEKLWAPLGMESDGYWLVDDDNVPMVFFGLNATARDYAKIGELFRNGGVWNGEQLVSGDWVKASITPDAPHLMPGDNPLSDFPMGYGYQWWVMDGDEQEFSAIGVYNQFIYVNPTKDLVIVKLSANNAYGTSSDGSTEREFETIELFRTIGNSLN